MSIRPKSKYFDPKSKRENPTWILVDIKYVSKFKNFVSIDLMRNETKLKDLWALRIGNRLSVTPVNGKEFTAIKKLS